MKGLYYHPDRIIDSSTMFLDYGRYSAITLFLELIESMAPEVLEDLKDIYDIYAEAEEWFITYHKGSQLWPSEWGVVKESNENFCFEYTQLKEKITSWVYKFNLVGDSDFYCTLGLCSLSFYYDDCKETERKKRLDEYNEIAKRYNVSLETLRRSGRYNRTWPYEEKLTLVNCIFQDEETDNIELSKSINDDNHLSFFERTFPVAFTPSNIFLKNDEGIYPYETMQTHYELINKIQQFKDDEDLLAYSGMAWDPRLKTWKDFESELDKMFKQYKDLYRERTEKFLIERGYLKEPEKRNLDHFKWLVHYLIQRWTLREIADFYSQNVGEEVHEDTVSHGIKSAARLVLIDLRKRKSIENN
ncbi:hypothetical protein A3842_07150 [Paenibacillus sp. P3E]|uniref:hypothetical protein n=1 Tax=Paenibacillus sp. P3E TaxID=1349435 RepID=UPI00093B2470|nr:hypothetical protein [Paenibacillus sp. P3E]OKP85953.1 hypothetical protein A3842_07150 [Paenibacillus sp. P3E]